MLGCDPHRGADRGCIAGPRVYGKGNGRPDGVDCAGAVHLRAERRVLAHGRTAGCVRPCRRLSGRIARMRAALRTAGVALIAGLVLALLGGVAAGQDDPLLLQAFSGFLKTRNIQFDLVPDLYDGGYSRISLHAKDADLGGMLVDEVWFKLVGVSLDVAALQQGRSGFSITGTPRFTAVSASSGCRSTSWRPTPSRTSGCGRTARPCLER